MSVIRVISTVFILLCLISSTIQPGYSAFNLYKKVIIYEDETYVIYQKGKLFWMEIGDPKSCKGPPIVYSPVNSSLTTWRKRQVTKLGSFDADIFFRDLPPPFGLLLPSDMLYINRIVYFEKEKASMTFFNGMPIYFLRALLSKVKNV